MNDIWMIYDAKKQKLLFYFFVGFFTYLFDFTVEFLRSFPVSGGEFFMGVQ